MLPKGKKLKELLIFPAFLHSNGRNQRPCGLEPESPQCSTIAACPGTLMSLECQHHSRVPAAGKGNQLPTEEWGKYAPVPE